MNKTRWILLALLCVLLTSHTAHSERHVYPGTPEMDQTACAELCKKYTQEYYEFFTSLSTDGSEKTIQNCECIDKEKPAS